MIYFTGPVKIIGSQSIQTIHRSYWPASLKSFREDCSLFPYTITQWFHRLPSNITTAPSVIKFKEQASMPVFQSIFF
jgi:hypothetical protein